MPDTPKETPLVEKHRQLGARLVEFAGWLMPIQYSGIVEEHRAVREAVGLFDVSHMGEIWFRGPGGVRAANRLVTNDVASLEPGSSLYSPMCNEHGGIVDDVLVYRVGADALFVVNASNTDKDFEWIRSHCDRDVRVENLSIETVQLALQGPKTEEVLKRAGLSSLPSVGRNKHTNVTIKGKQVLASRTGYTGEDGFEFYYKRNGSDEIWNALFHAGNPLGLKPIGLGARDTLRFEMGYCLYGNDIDETTTPLEAGLGWTVKLEKRDFVGRDSLLKQKASGLKRKLVGMEMLEHAIARKGCAVAIEGREIGIVTSGTFSPSLQKGLAMGYVSPENSAPGTELSIGVRGKEFKTRVTRLPFYKCGSRK
jgi:aminomethyltransferase